MPKTPRQSIVALVPVAVLAWLAFLGGGFLSGCRQSTFSSPVPIASQLVSAKPVIVIPAQRWKRSKGTANWMFQSRATLVCWVRDPGQAPLILRLRPDEATMEHRFRFEWNGEPLPEQQVEETDEGLRIELLTAQLSAGHHELKLFRDYKREAARVRKRVPNVFSEIRYESGESREVLTNRPLERFQLLTQFLQNGVIGQDRERRSGVLFVGPAQHRLALGPKASGTFVVEPRNLSKRQALFRAGDQSIKLGPGEDGRLQVTLGPAPQDLELEVEGHPQGYFLWAMPRVEAKVAAKDLPPIILVTLDTTRRDALGPYADQSDLVRPDLTPTLDRMARGATVFEQAFSTAPWTLPSHASIMTGLYPSKHGAGVSQWRLAGFPTLAELLSERGYFTAGISAGDLSASRFGLAQGFDLYRDPDQFDTPGENVAHYVDGLLDGYGHLPLFLFINYFDAHAVYQAPEPWEQKLGVPALRDKLRGRREWDDLFSGEMSGWRRFVEGEVEATPEGLEYFRAAYLAEVAYLDHLLGRLFDKLRQLDLYNRALIVITADHGELLGEGGYFSHGVRLDPELVEIPLIIKWPGQTEGHRSRRLASLIDLFPTVLQAAGVTPPSSDGHLLEAKSDHESPHPFLFLEEHESIVHPLPKAGKISRHLFGVQRPGFRQVVWDQGQNCFRRQGHAWRVEDCTTDLAKVLAAIQQHLGLVKTEEGDADVGAEVMESLKALGYI